MSIQDRHQFPGIARASAGDERTKSILRESAGDFCAELSSDGRLSRISERGLGFLGCPANRDISLLLIDLVVAADHERVHAAIEECFANGSDMRLELQVLKQLLDPVRVSLSLFRIAPDLALIVWSDITLLSGLRNALRQSRDNDALTGFAHRDAFAARVLEAARSATEPSRCRLLMIDFVGWGAIKRALGRIEEGRAIAGIASRFADVMTDAGLVHEVACIGRLVDTRLAAVFDADDQELDRLLPKLQERLTEPLATDFMTFSPHPRIVVVLLEGRGSSGQEGVDTLEQTEAALETRLVQNDNSVSRLKVSEFALMRGPVLCKALNAAFVNGEFDLAWRPVCAADSAKSLHSFNVDLRWMHDGLLVAPGNFLPLASASGLLAPLSSWAMRVMGARLVEWRRTGIEVRCIAPMTREEFASKGLIESMEKGFAAAELDRQACFVEVEASTLAGDATFAQRRLGELRDAGFLMAAGGIGGPDCALVDLPRWPLSLVKLDPDCLARVGTEPGAARVASSLIRLIADLGIDAVATNVDDEAQWQWLLDEGAGRNRSCLAMGNALGIEMTASETGAWLSHTGLRATAPTPTRLSTLAGTGAAMNVESDATGEVAI